MTDILIPLIGIPAWFGLGFVTALVFDRITRTDTYSRRMSPDDRMLVILAIICWPVVVAAGLVILPIAWMVQAIERINR